jgi:hypothetical protein
MARRRYQKGSLLPTAARILQKRSAVKRIVTRLQKKCGVYDEQAITHSVLPFTIVSRAQVLHASRLRRVVRAFGKELGKILAPSPFLSPDIPCQTVHRVFCRIALVRGEHVRIALGDPHSRCDQAAAFGFVAEFPTSSSQYVGQTVAPRYHPRRWTCGVIRGEGACKLLSFRDQVTRPSKVLSRGSTRGSALTGECGRDRLQPRSASLGNVPSQAETPSMLSA